MLTGDWRHMPPTPPGEGPLQFRMEGKPKLRLRFALRHPDRASRDVGPAHAANVAAALPV